VTIIKLALPVHPDDKLSKILKLINSNTFQYVLLISNTFQYLLLISSYSTNNVQLLKPFRTLYAVLSGRPVHLNNIDFWESIPPYFNYCTQKLSISRYPPLSVASYLFIQLAQDAK